MKGDSKDEYKIEIMSPNSSHQKKPMEKRNSDLYINKRQIYESKSTKSLCDDNGIDSYRTAIGRTINVEDISNELIKIDVLDQQCKSSKSVQPMNTKLLEIDEKTQINIIRPGSGAQIGYSSCNQERDQSLNPGLKKGALNTLIPDNRNSIIRRLPNDTSLGTSNQNHLRDLYGRDHQIVVNDFSRSQLNSNFEVDF